MNTPVSQRGISAVSWMFILAVLAFFASVAFNMVPHYLDYMSLDKIISSSERDAANGTPIHSMQDLRSHIQKGMQVNGLRDIALDQVMVVKQEENLFHIRLKYEKREPLIRNLSLVASFEKEYQLRMP